MGLEPTGLLHLTPFPGELLSHSVNPPYRYLFSIFTFAEQMIIYHKNRHFSRGNYVFALCFFAVRRFHLHLVITLTRISLFWPMSSEYAPSTVVLYLKPHFSWTLADFAFPVKEPHHIFLRPRFSKP